eukprot:TRINITY_DN1287_c0_g1_i1.p1 TRINITY_DN1287_c0_g1~~TRINITY_DN1287_c0_g1_i1.p1  ORF type:complete len:397 (-),score=94.44 TRINITY_DN1287_c0_g1_i1:534-1553(-)
MIDTSSTNQTREEKWRNRELTAEKLLNTNSHLPTVSNKAARKIHKEPLQNAEDDDQKPVKKAKEHRPPMKKARPSFEPLWDDEGSSNAQANRIEKGKKPSAATIPKISIVDAGNSYRPDYVQHQDVLGVVLAQTIELQDKIAEVDARLPVSTKKHLLNGMFPKNDDDNDEEDTEEENRAAAAVTERITARSRRRMEKRQQRRIHQEDMEERKVLEAEINRVNELQKEIDEEEKLLQLKQQKRKADADQLAHLPGNKGKLSRNRFVEPIKPFLATDELPQSFRSIQGTKVDVIKDHFTHWERRGMIPVTVKYQTARRKVKMMKRRGMDLGDPEWLASADP